MLSQMHVHPTIPASDMERARRFYHDKLGMTPAQETPGGAIYECADGSWFLLYPSGGAGTAEHTVAGWMTDDIQATVADLKKHGVVFEEYDYPGLKTVNSIAETGPTQAAWFKDSEGNILGIVQLT
jgi:catechol 2,3-dioxygenase-like lactoylglutathione lyase family enzyme